MGNSIRTSSIAIDMPRPSGAQWVTASIQGLETDFSGEVTSIEFDVNKIHRRVDLASRQSYTVTDPLSGEEITANIAAIVELIKAAVVQWMLEEYPGAVHDSNSNTVFLDDSNS